MKWLFKDAPNVAVLTSARVMNRLKPILYVTHDEDDGMWQFHDGDEVREEDAKIISFQEVIVLDNGIMELHDLPEGWVAYRNSIHDDWTRSKRK